MTAPERAGAAAERGDDARSVPYGELMRLEELLPVTLVHEGDVDRMLFMVSHQVSEMWFALVLEHLLEARTALLDDRPDVAAGRIRRLPALVRILVTQMDALATLGHDAFLRIRTDLGSASGFQSAQWREVEYLCGLRDRRYLGTPGFSAAERARLRKRLECVSVADAYETFLDRRRAAGRAVRPDGDQVAAALLEFDEAVVVWRSRHAALAERFIGGRAGTGGSAGAAYLWRATRHRLFPRVWPGDEDPHEHDEPGTDRPLAPGFMRSR